MSSIGLGLVLVGDRKLSQFQRSSLQLLEIDYFETRRNFLAARQGLVMSRPNILNFSKTDLAQVDEVKRLALNTPFEAQEFPARILISRSKSRRFNSQIDLIERRLQDEGWVAVHSEELSFEDPVHWFSSATSIVGAHRAGLANMLWMLAGSQVIELADRDY